MNRKNECKSCRTSVVEGIEDIDLEMDDSKTVGEEIYQKRLNICMECPSLVYGSTCKYSGCIVSFRAIIKDKACPDPGGAKW